MPPKGNKKASSIPPAVGTPKNQTPQTRNLRFPRETPASAVPAFNNPDYGGPRGGQREFSSAPPSAVDPFGIPLPNAQRRPASFSQPTFLPPTLVQPGYPPFPGYSKPPGYPQQPGFQAPFPPSLTGPSGAAPSQQGRKHQRQESSGANVSPQKRRFAEQATAVFREEERQLTDAEKIRLFDDYQRQRVAYGEHAAQEIRRGSQENFALEDESPTIRDNSGVNSGVAAPEFRPLNDIVSRPDAASDIESRLPAREDEPEFADDDYVPEEREKMAPKAAGRKKTGSRAGQAAKAKASAAPQKPSARFRPRAPVRGEDWDGVYRAGDVVPDDREAQREAFAQYVGGVEEDLHELMCAACAVNLTTTARQNRDPCDIVHNPCARCKKSKKDCVDVVSRALRL